MSEPKFCKDCRWLEKVGAPMQPRCLHVESTYRGGDYLVSGEPTQSFAVNARSNNTSCGPEGKWWEAIQ